jgi:hypothetical protein
VDDAKRICHGNRTDSRPFQVGPWGVTDDFDEEDPEEGPGGLELDGEEKFVAVQPVAGGESALWEVWWDEKDDKLKGVEEVDGRIVLRVSLEREYKENEGEKMA